MGFWGLIVLLVLFSGLAVVVDRRIQARKQLQTANVDEKTERFRLWAQAAFADTPKLQQWLALLPEEAVKALAASLEDYCRDLGFQLDWVTDGKTAQNLAPSLQRIAAQYVKSCYDAYQSQEDVQGLTAWLNYEQEPAGKAQQEFGARLLTQLIDMGATAQAARSLLTASDAERAGKIQAALRDAAQRNPSAFRQALKTVTVGPVPPTTAPAAVGPAAAVNAAPAKASGAKVAANSN